MVATGEDCTVSSELYSEFDYISSAKPITKETNVVSKFMFNFPPGSPKRDSDGDLIVDRKICDRTTGTVEIEHSVSTALDLVGLQIWRGALLLADWLLHFGKEILKKDDYVVELGAGVGLSSIVASMFAPVICTDLDRGDLLKLIENNIERNKSIVRHPVKVVNLDFTSQVLPQEIVDALSRTNVVIAADVVYDDAITRAFVKTVDRILSQPGQRCVYVALEKRFVFTIEDCDTVAPCYEYFLECVRTTEELTMEEIPLTFPQYFQYDRVKELVLLKISCTN